MEESSISRNGHVHGYGYDNPYQLSEHFWNALTTDDSKGTYNNFEVGIDARSDNDFQDVIVYKEAEVEIEIEIEDCTNNVSRRNDSEGRIVDADTDDDDDETYEDMRFRVEDFQDMTVDYSHVKIPDDSDVEVTRGKPTYYSYANATNASDNLVKEDYNDRFYKATNKGDWAVMKEIGTAHPETLTMTGFHNQGTALHNTLWYGQDRVEIAKCLVKLMKRKGLETMDEDGYTTLALAVLLHHDIDLLRCMIEKNLDLLNVGAPEKIPLVVASSKGFTGTIEFLYPLTDRENVDVNFLNQCIGLNLFGIARDLLELSPEFLDSWDDHYIYPTHALARSIAALQISNIQHKKLRDGKTSSDDQESIRISQAYELLQLIIRIKTNIDHRINDWEFLEDAMMEAAKHGIIKFITEMLKVNRELISINKDGKNMFWHAIMNRQEKVFNLIYALDQKKPTLLSFDLDDKGNPAEKRTEKNPNILHFTAQCPSSSVLDRISGPALQMQREVQWFKAVQEVTIYRYRQDLNESGQTPYALFLDEHKSLLEEGEKSMKKTAAAASTVSGLIVTTMFGAALAVVTAIYQVQASGPHDVNEFFKVFLIFAALSLSSCTASIIVFLGILASRYSPEDFLASLPRKFMIGFWALFFAIATMMLAFCFALYTMLKSHKLRFVLIAILVFSIVPVASFFVYICPLLCKICRSTCKTVFDKSTRLPEAKKKGTDECC